MFILISSNNYFSYILLNIHIKKCECLKIFIRKLLEINLTCFALCVRFTYWNGCIMQKKEHLRTFVSWNLPSLKICPYQNCFAVKVHLCLNFSCSAPNNCYYKVTFFKIAFFVLNIILFIFHVLPRRFYLVFSSILQRIYIFYFPANFILISSLYRYLLQNCFSCVCDFRCISRR